MTTELSNKMNAVVEKALKKGAERAEIMVNRAQNFSLESNRGEISKYSLSGPESITLRIEKDSHFGASFCENWDEDSIDFMVNQSLEYSELKEKDTYSRIGKDASTKITGDLYDPSKEVVHETKEKIDFVLEMEKAIRNKGDDVKEVPYNGFGESISETFLVNSEGADCRASDKYFSCYTSALCEDSSSQALFYKSDLSRTFKGLDSEKCINYSYEEAKRILPGGPIPSGEYEVIFDLDEYQSLFGTFSLAFSGKGAMDKVNPFREKLGETVADTNLTIRDLPRFEKGFFKSYFDGEGVPTKDLTLFDQGVFKNFIHNTKTSQYFKQPNTGHASRPSRGVLGVSTHQVVIEPGKVEDEKLKSGKWLQIIRLQGLHSGTDAISGDFSLGAWGLLHYQGENGHRTDPYFYIEMPYGDMQPRLTIESHALKTQHKLIVTTREISDKNLRKH